MPTYEYKCKNCNHEFEEFQPMSAASLVMCPKCKTPNLVRAIGGGGGMIFKGSGFYHTDYKNAKTDTKESKPTPSTDKKADPSTKPAPPTTPTKPKE
jgi:putative FmdB family regulatory protein